MLFTPLPCEEIVLRALRRKDWFDEDTKRITPAAFLRWPGRDRDGLSVNIQARTNLEVWLATFNKSYGADSLHTGKVRTLGLDVGQTEQDLRDQWDHALITALPFAEDDPDRAESLASELAKMSRAVDRTVRKKASK